MRPKLSDLPQIEKLLNLPNVLNWVPKLSRPLLARLAGESVESFRRRLQQEGDFPDTDQLKLAILADLEARCREFARRRVQRVINATGIVLHTNMGRSPLSPQTWQAVSALNTGYSTLELDLDTGKRGRRNGLIPDLLNVLIGAEASLVVNNNAAAVFLLLSALARDREVIVSRGEQVQIGGGFRIPDILALSGARLIEVGTTNVTTLDDYLQAVTKDTAMVLRVHNSNFRIRGFTEQPSTGDLAKALPDEVILAVDQGSGATSENTPGEINAATHLKEGAQILCFSGDKILGGPQSGLVVGQKFLVDQLAAHPLLRTFRPGKTVYSLLEEFLIRKLNGKTTGTADKALQTPLSELQKRGQQILGDIKSEKVALTSSTAALGGGSAPDEHFPSVSLVLNAERSAQSILDQLRDNDPPIIATISGDKVHLNLATLQVEELEELSQALLSWQKSETL